MRALMLALSLSLHPAGDHAAGDRWFGADKIKHFFLSAFVESVSYAALRTARVGRDPALVAASAVTLAAGIGKEVHDRQAGEPFSVRDLSWDLAGGAAAAAILEQAR
ncbi:MAG: hypothetical protein IRY91_02915 [Gemmatimonadaceae bacterium]|nr:hypothetical protein [Gemmatimonadaceae bacterium]